MPAPRRDAAPVEDAATAGTADGAAAADVPASPADARPVEPVDAAALGGDAGLDDADVGSFDADLDAGAPPPDAGSPPDRGVPTFPDAAAPPDASQSGADAAVPPPAQTQITYVPMTAVVSYGVTDVDAAFTLSFDNAGPGAETFSATQVVIVASAFRRMTIAVTPASHVAPVGVSEATFRMVPGSAMPAPSPSDLRTFCAFNALFPTVMDITLSNGAAGRLGDVRVMCP